MHHFLEAIARNITDSSTPVRDHIIILPTRRSAYHLKQIIAQKHPDGWLPRFTTLNKWTEEVSGLKVADRLQLKFMCYEAYAKSLGDDAVDLSRFFGWGDTLIDDFNDIESGNIQPEILFRELNEYTEISNLSFLDEPLTDKQLRYQKFWRSLKDVHKNFNEALLAEKIGYAGLIARKASEAWPDFSARNPDVRIIAAGFNALSHSEKSLFEKMCGDGICEVFYDSDPSYLDDPANHAGLFIRRNVSNGLGKALSHPSPFGSAPIEITYSEAPDKIAQADVAAALLEKIPADELSETALVLADESMLIPMLNRLPPVVREANITMGISLSNSSFADWIDKIFELRERMMRDPGGNFVISERLSALVRHPFSRLLNAENTAAPKVDLRASYTPLSAFRNEIRDSAYAWLLPLLGDWENDADQAAEAFGEFAEAAAPLIQNSKKSGPELRMAGEALAMLMRLLQKLKRYPQIKNLQQDALHHLISDALRSASTDLIGEPAQGLQIMGLLETRALSYRHVILCDVNEEVLPGSPQFDSFIPFEIRGYHKMPGKREKESVFAYYFYRLLQGSTSFHTVFHNDNSGPWGGERSRYISQLEHYIAPKYPQVSVTALTFETDLTPPPARKLVIEKTEEVLNHIFNYITVKKVSASGINRFFESSLEWYYENVLKLKTPEEEGQLSHADFGTLVHKTLEQLYKKFKKGHIFSVSDIESMKKSSANALKQCFEESDRVTQFDRGLNRLQFETAKAMVNAYFKSELAAVKKGENVEYIDAELELSRSMNFTLRGREITAEFKGSADLVMRRDGTIRVIDFKTGNVKSAELGVKEFEMSAFAKKPKALQLMLYSWMARGTYPNEAIETQIISLPRPGDRGLSVKLTMESAEDEAAFEEVLQEVIFEMTDPEIPLSANADFIYAAFEPVLGGEETA